LLLLAVAFTSNLYAFLATNCASEVRIEK